MNSLIDTIWNTVRPYTLLSKERIANNVQCIQEVIDKNIPGDILEIGVYKGGSIMSMLLALNQRQVVRNVRLYDTFTGLTPATEYDIEIFSNKHYNQLLQSIPWFKCEAGLQEVQTNLKIVPYSEQHLHYHVGDVMKCTEIPDQIAILRLDTDLYDSTKFELENFYPHVSSGGIVIVDDYGYWKGSRKAVDDFLVDKPELKLIPIDYTGVYFYKP